MWADQQTDGQLNLPSRLNTHARAPRLEMHASAARCVLVSFTTGAGRCSVRA
jgi:hypothetical protein